MSRVERGRRVLGSRAFVQVAGLIVILLQIVGAQPARAVERGVIVSAESLIRNAIP